jgi:hypothetical protein
MSNVWTMCITGKRSATENIDQRLVPINCIRQEESRDPADPIRWIIYKQRWPREPPVGGEFPPSKSSFVEGPCLKTVEGWNQVAALPRRPPPGASAEIKPTSKARISEASDGDEYLSLGRR